MTTSLTTLVTATSQADRLAAMYVTAADLGVDVVGVQAERLFRALFEIEAAQKAQEDQLRVKIAQAGLLDTVKLAGSAWVTLLALGFFDLPRAPATSTVGAASLACGPLAVAGTVVARQARFQTGTGVIFTNADAFTVAPNATIPVTLVASVPGSTGNVALNSTWTNVTTLTNCTLTNPGTSGSWITSAGVDEESDDSLIARCRARWAATSYGGASSAYRQWIADAFTAAGVASTITRLGVDDGNPNGPGSTDIYLANSTGPATVGELATVDAYLQPRRSLGTGPLRVLAAPALSVPVVAVLYGNTGAVAPATAMLAALQSTISLGGIIYRADLIARLMALSGVYNVVLSTPAADVDLTGFDVPTFAPSLTAVA